MLRVKLSWVLAIFLGVAFLIHLGILKPFDISKAKESILSVTSRNAACDSKQASAAGSTADKDEVVAQNQILRTELDQSKTDYEELALRYRKKVEEYEKQLKAKESSDANSKVPDVPVSVPSADVSMMGKDAGFNVVVPFVHETKVRVGLHTPHHFVGRNMQVSTLGEYFSIPKMKEYGNIVEYDEWARASAWFVRQREWRLINIVSAVVYFEWFKEVQPGSEFRWCDKLDEKQPSLPVADGMPPMYMNLSALSPHVMYERRVCISGKMITDMRADLTPAFFDRMFEFVESGVVHKQIITIAFQNYRKHGWTPYILSLFKKPENEDIEQRVVLSEKILANADVIRGRKIGEKPYIGIHFRAGKVLSKIQRFDDGRYLKKWALGCIAMLKSRVDKLQANPPMKVYIATDMLNQGMKGGEMANRPTQRTALDDIKANLFESFPGAVVLDETDVSQVSAYDAMGMASLLDMGMCVRATYFVSMRDSFAKLVAAERKDLNLHSDVFLCDFSEAEAHAMRNERPSGGTAEA